MSTGHRIYGHNPQLKNDPVFTRLKHLVQRIVLTTAFPPFLYVYRWIYELIISATTRLLAVEPTVQAVYLRRGYAKGEWLPGLSDLDFQVIVDGLDAKKREQLLRRYSKLSRWTLLPDEILVIEERSSLLAQLEYPRKRYRLMEGKATWKLLYGKDCIQDLPELSVEEMQSGLLTEIAVWWTIFAWQILQSRINQQKPVLCNSICYKTTAEILKACLALNRDFLVFTRKEALINAGPCLGDTDNYLIETLQRIASQRYVGKQESVLDETLPFVMRQVSSVHKTYSRANLKTPTAIDGSINEQLWSKTQRAHIDKLIDHINDGWSDAFDGIHLAASYLHNLEELLLLLVLDPERAPCAELICELYEIHTSQPQSSVRLYLVFNDTAFQIDASYYSGGWSSVLSPLTSPDVFSYISRADFTVRGKPSPPGRKLVWTTVAEDLCRNMRQELVAKLRSPNLGANNNLGCLRAIWKAVQLEVINRTSKTGRVLFPHSLEAIERACTMCGITLPQNFQLLGNLFRDELRGESHDIEKIVPEAIHYLEYLYNLPKGRSSSIEVLR